MRSLAPHLIAWMTIFLATWVGISLLAARPALGWAVLAFAVLRLGLWIRQLVRSRR